MVLLFGSLASTLVVYSLFLIGYYAAWNDFKPKKIDINEDFRLAPRAYYDIAPIRKHRELTDRELGLLHIDESVGDPHIQRQNKMREAVIHYAAEDPQAAAEVLRSWISQQ
ncbi:hypothetical protein K8I31_13130 [bacterium]|nr:hypothetical protein [bacterium]